MRRTDSILLANLSFEGCAGSEENVAFPLVAPELVQAKFLNTAADPNIDPEGNWQITWENGTPSSAFATLTRGGSWTTNSGANSNRYGLQRDLNADWQVNLYIEGVTTFGTPTQISENRQVSNEYYYSVLGRWVGEATGIASETEIIGSWAYGDENGCEVWTKVDAEIVSVYSAAQSVTYGETVLISSQYAGPENDMRGNRPTAWLVVLGDGLWGWQNYWIPEESGIEIGSARYLCPLQDGEYPTRRNSFDCFSSGGAVGMIFDLNIWPDARPGLQYLYFNDQVIPFKLELSGYPASEQCS